MSPTVITPISAKEANEPVDGKTVANIVFVPVDLFTTFFRKYDLSGSVVINQNSPDASPYKYLAHVRNLHTACMADSGISEDSLFSIVLGTQKRPYHYHQTNDSRCISRLDRKHRGEHDLYR